MSRSATILILALSLAAPALAVEDGRIFVTRQANGYGLTHPENALIPTYSTVDVNNFNTNGYDYYYGRYVVGSFPPVNSPASVTVQPGELLYTWLQFTNAALPNNLRVITIVVQLSNVSGNVPALQSALYLCNDRNAGGQKRWDGEYDAQVHYHLNCNQLIGVAVIAQGLHRSNLPDPANLYSGQTAGDMFLYAGFRAPSASGTYRIGVRHDMWGNPEISYDLGTSGSWADAYITVVPEPASVALLLIVALVRRR
jgi:hypothetical protein